MMPCVSISQITVPDSLSISPTQVKNIYIGLKQGEIFKQRLDACVSLKNELNNIIQEQNKFLQLNMVELSQLNADLATKNDLLLKSAVDIQILKNKKIPWYRHPILYTVLGLAGGVYISK